MRNVLFLCTANSARSILAEAILATRGAGRFASYSAGSRPRGEPNPVALRMLGMKGHDISRLASKSWELFAAADAPTMHAVITVCDNAKGESCPVWPLNGEWGRPVQAHWGIPDPAGDGHDGAVADFEQAYSRLVARIEAMLALDETRMGPHEWANALCQIGRDAEGATG